MAETSFIIWLVWFLFAASFVYVVARKYVPAALAVRPLGVGLPGERGGAVAQPWLFCEDGTALDKRAQWFRVAGEGTTIVGNRPQNASGDTLYIYLTAHDIKQRQIVIRYDRNLRRHVLQHGDGKLLHNNEPVTHDEPIVLTDGDTLDLGDVTRLRFTFSGPPEALP
jgi:hypothetical protein